MFAGPSEALYPLERFRNASNYVPNAYIAGGRTTSIAIDDVYRPLHRVHHAAGGGVWRTKDIFASNVNWDYLGGPLGINSAGAISFDPNDVTRKTIYVGTGEANICGSGWSRARASTSRPTKARPGRRSATPSSQGRESADRRQARRFEHHLRRHDHRARGYSSSCCSGVTRPVPGVAKWGLYKTTNGGASWSFIHNGSTNVADCGLDPEFNNTGICSPRGVRNVELDPSNSNILYASSYARCLALERRRATWVQIKPSLNAGIIQTRPSIDVNCCPTARLACTSTKGNNTGAVLTAVPERRRCHRRAGLHRPDSSDHGVAGWATFNLCTAQCWYDMFVETPKGHPDIVYVGGSYSVR